MLERHIFALKVTKLSSSIKLRHLRLRHLWKQIATVNWWLRDEVIESAVFIFLWIVTVWKNVVFSLRA
jgi:hypothetical protein